MLARQGGLGAGPAGLFKAQALSQCRNWISKNLPQARVIDVVSTAAAAEHASSEEFAAAVASRAAGTPTT